LKDQDGRAAEGLPFGMFGHFYLSKILLGREGGELKSYHDRMEIVEKWGGYSFKKTRNERLC
jgi:hypothetical protein